MNSLNRKLRRDLWKMKGQALAIILVIVGGVATFVIFLITMDSLYSTRDRYYADYRFADIFASLKRAPETLKERIGEIPGVDRVETRVTVDVKLDVPGFPEPVTAKLPSIPDAGPPLLNALYLREGRMIDPRNGGKVLVSENFALAHDFSPGDRIGAVINGRWKKLTLVGIALSPEFVLRGRPGSISPDYKRYGILWMGRNSLAAAYDRDGAFNDLALTLVPGTEPDDVPSRLDGVLARYGGLGAYTRDDQLSNRFLREEFRQLQTNAEIFPMIFIGVAAFLLNGVGQNLYGTLPVPVPGVRASTQNRRRRDDHHPRFGPGGHPSRRTPGLQTSAGGGDETRTSEALPQNRGGVSPSGTDPFTAVPDHRAEPPAQTGPSPLHGDRDRIGLRDHGDRRFF